VADPISYQPTDGLSYDPSDSIYWNKDALDKEIERVFEVCHGCRMCFKYCDSFPSLFDFVDNEHDGDVRKLTEAQVDTVMEQCFQCKLCEVQCPYTPRDSHEFKLDFPKLVHRWAAQKAARDGLSFRDKVLGDPDATGRLARASLGMANIANRNGLHRWFMQKFLGIHRDKQLPEFASSTFERWAQAEGLMGEPGAEAVIFQTCYVQNNEPQIGRDTVDVYNENQIETRCVAGLQCCGMPAWEHGDLASVQAQAKKNLDLLEPHVDAGSKVIALQPSCAMMLRREYPELVAEEDRPRAKKLAEAVRDPSEYVWSIRKEDRFAGEFKSAPSSRVSYHAPCHLRAQAVGFRGRDLIRRIDGVDKITTVMECCGHDGTYAMKVEGFEPSQRAGARSFEGMKEAEAEVWVTDCSLAAIQFEQHAGVRAMHPMSVLARAYREDGFGNKEE